MGGNAYRILFWTKGIDNAWADALSRKAELQSDEKLLGALL